MGNPFKFIGSKIKAAVRFVLRLGDKQVRERAEDVADAVSDMLIFAEPAVRIVARLTPTTADDLVVEALFRMNRTANDILSIEDKSVRDGLLLSLAAEIARDLMRQAIADLGEIRIGRFVLSDADDVASNVVRAAVGFAYSAFIRQLVVRA